MILTEEEAKTKWCPHIRISAAICQGGDIVAAAARNRVGELPPTPEHPNDPSRFNCCASECSQWRWGPSQHYYVRVGNEKIPAEERRGYCGLAGKPDVR